MRPTPSMQKALKALQNMKKQSRPLHLLALAALVAPLAVLAPPAHAGRCDTVSKSSSPTFRSNRGTSYTRSASDRYGHSDSRRFADRRHVSAPSGYFKQVYRPAVYRTTYDAHGRAFRVCIRAAGYERVWVSTRSSHRRSHW